MAKRKRRRKSKSSTALKKTLQFEIIGIILVGLSIIAIAQLGAFGHALSLFSRFFMGEWSIILLVGILLLGLYFMVKRALPYLLTRQLIGIYLIIASILLLSHVTLFDLLSEGGPFAKPSVLLNTWELFWLEATGKVTSSDLGGGMFGAILFATFNFLFAEAGAKIAAFICIIVGIILLTGRTFGDVFSKTMTSLATFLGKQWRAFVQDVKELKNKKENSEKKKPKKEKQNLDEPHQNEEEYIESSNTPIIRSYAENIYDQANESNVKSKPNEPNEVEESSDIKIILQRTSNNQEDMSAVEHYPIETMNFVDTDNTDYELPPLTLLRSAKKTDQSNENKRIEKNIMKLQETFESFGVDVNVKEGQCGPSVTKYIVVPGAGVKVSKIVSLSDDIALALAAKGIRIEAPIPGISAIGIEVPNSEVAMVSLREVLESKPANKHQSKLLIGLGKDVYGNAVMAELNKMPHLLVAGATGSGKSVCINGIITSILTNAKPHEVKLMMIDPKMVELNMYNGIPHLLAPVVTDAKKASQALKKVVNEMERRYELFAHTGTRNIEGYNDYIRLHNMENEEKQSSLPFIVVIVDELADLMMVASSDVEDAITRLAQMARAAGIHLIIATQRPSVDVITGVIKANIPSRIAFSVSSMTDSRTILDMGGAEKLLGRGDMLFLPVGASKPIRVQGAFLSDQEVEDIVAFVISQQQAQYHEDMIPDEAGEVKGEVEDALYDSAVQLVIEMETASVSMLQRRFRIGYSRAARLIDEMEARGIVGPYEGSKPRSVLVDKEQFEQNVKHS
ncbi:MULTISPECIES: DNA translocase FtsK [Bacillus]|uniref:DNA translocase FtsK n=1 Tax=Bacillus TaxID=1386 RepID=UPI0002E5C0EE|nr:MULTISPECIES: DNA translocase FtsK [Bacillus]